MTGPTRNAVIPPPAPHSRVLVLALLALAAGYAPVARAQGVAPVEWELLGHPVKGPVQALAFAPGPAPDGSADTLYAGALIYLHRRPPDGDWSENLHRGASGNDNVAVTAAGHLLTGYTRLQRSTDAGRTWEDADVTGVDALFQSALPALGGAAFAGADRAVWRSDAGGAPGSWTRIADIGAAQPPGAAVMAFAEVPESAALPSGRLLAATESGLAASDDGGHTWALSDVWQPGRLYAHSLAVAVDPAHPYGGTVYAGVRDFAAGHAAVYASGDGGRAWGRRHAFEPGAFGLTDPSPDWAWLAVGPGGSVWAAVEAAEGTPSVGVVVVSGDGGRTWAEAGRGLGGVGVTVLVLGRDGRLYAGTSGGYREALGGGVFRTRDPLVPVADGVDAPAGPSGLRLDVRPNPSRGAAEVVVSLAEASDVRVSVVDALGREVAVLLDGPAGPGDRVVGVDTVGWPAGVYAVRATAGGEAATARLVVVR